RRSAAEHRLRSRSLPRHPRADSAAGRPAGSAAARERRTGQRRGAVGHYAVQFAKARGARVLATVSGEAKAAHARGAGADTVINYRTEDVGARVKALTGGRGVDAVIEVDLTANAKLLPAVLRPHGVAVVYGTGAAEASIPASWLMVNSATLRLFLIYDISAADRAAVLDELVTLLA